MKIKIFLFALALLINSPSSSAEKKPVPSGEQASSEAVKPKAKFSLFCSLKITSYEAPIPNKDGNSKVADLCSKVAILPFVT